MEGTSKIPYSDLNWTKLVCKTERNRHTMKASTAFTIAAMASLSAVCSLADVLTVSKAPVVDGKLDEAVWSQATWETGFQRFRRTPKSRAVPAQTEFAILADADNIYIGIKAHHRNMKELRSHGPRDIWNAEAVEFYFSPSGNTFDFYQFLVTYQGLKHAMFYSESGTIHPDPYGPAWEFKVGDDDKCWYAEVRIPLTAFYMTRSDAWSTEIGRAHV